METQAGNSEEPKRELGQLEGGRTQPFQLLPLCCCCSSINNGRHCARAAETQTCSILVFLYRIFLKNSQVLGPEETGEKEWHKKKKRKERLAMVFLVWVSQAASLSTMKPVTQPANKPTSSFHSAGPLARDQVMPPNKELLSCITSCQRGHAGYSLSPGSASVQHKASTSPASLPPAPIISHHYTSPYPGRAFISGPQKEPLHVKLIRNKRFKPIKHVPKITFPLKSKCNVIKYVRFNIRFRFKTWVQKWEWYFWRTRV